MYACFISFSSSFLASTPFFISSVSKCFVFLFCFLLVIALLVQVLEDLFSNPLHMVTVPCSGLFSWSLLDSPLNILLLCWFWSVSCCNKLSLWLYKLLWVLWFLLWNHGNQVLSWDSLTQKGTIPAPHLPTGFPEVIASRFNHKDLVVCIVIPFRDGFLLQGTFSVMLMLVWRK